MKAKPSIGSWVTYEIHAGPCRDKWTKYAGYVVPVGSEATAFLAGWFEGRRSRSR